MRRRLGLDRHPITKLWKLHNWVLALADDTPLFGRVDRFQKGPIDSASCHDHLKPER